MAPQGRLPFPGRLRWGQAGPAAGEEAEERHRETLFLLCFFAPGLERGAAPSCPARLPGPPWDSRPQRPSVPTRAGLLGGAGEAASSSFVSRQKWSLRRELGPRQRPGKLAGCTMPWLPGRLQPCPVPPASRCLSSTLPRSLLGFGFLSLLSRPFASRLPSLLQFSPCSLLLLLRLLLSFPEPGAVFCSRSVLRAVSGRLLSPDVLLVAVWPWAPLKAKCLCSIAASSRPRVRQSPAGRSWGRCWLLRWGSGESLS